MAAVQPLRQQQDGGCDVPLWGVIVVILLALSLGITVATARQKAAECRRLERQLRRMGQRLSAAVESPPVGPESEPAPSPDRGEQTQVLPLHDPSRDAADVTAVLADYPSPERTSLVDQAWDSVRRLQEEWPLPVPARVPQRPMADAHAQTEAAVRAMQADTQLLLAGTRDQSAEPEWDLDVALDDPQPGQRLDLGDAYDVYPTDDEDDDGPPPPAGPGGDHLPPADQRTDTATMPMAYRYDWSGARPVAPLHWGRGLMRFAAAVTARIYTDPRVQVRRVASAGAAAVAAVGDWLPGLVAGRHVVRRHRRRGGSWAAA